MKRTQIYLTEEEREALLALTKQTGKSQSELIRDAIDHFCDLHKPAKQLSFLRKAKGLWKDRQDLNDIKALRKDWDR